MISFIVIGKNEGWKLEKCFSSILDTVDRNRITDYEVIYVDSCSEDNSLEYVSHYSEVQIYEVTGKTNAAVARNIGALESKGETLFFIDGDMEIHPDFLPHVYSEENGLRYDFVSGNWINYHYDEETATSEKDVTFKSQKQDLTEDKYVYTCGGLFLIKRDLWFSIDGMKTKYRRNQDWDFCLRMAKKGTLLRRKKEILANHYTVLPSRSSESLLKLLISGAKYYKGVLFRDHFFNKYHWAHFCRTSYTTILLWLSVLSHVFLHLYIVYIIYLSVLIIRSLKNNKSHIKLFMYKLSSMLFVDVTLLFSILFFWPTRKDLNYQAVDRK